MAYTPPNASSLLFNFNGVYAPPNAGSLRFEFAPPASPTIQPDGITPGSFGAPAVGNRTQYIVPAQFVPVTLGNATVWNYTTTVAASGPDTSRYGTAVVAFGTRYAVPTGIAPGAFGVPAASISIPRPVAPTGIISGDFGAASAANRNRTLTLDGLAAGSIGFHSALNRDRPISIPGLASGAFGTPDMQLTVRTLSALGITTLGMGTPSVDLLTRYIAPVGAAFVTRPRPRVWSPFAPQVVKPFWGAYSASGNAPPPTTYGIDTSVAYFVPAPPADPFGLLRATGIAPGGIGATDVENQNRSISVPGFAGEFGTTSVHPPLTCKPDGIASLAMGTAATGYRIRAIFVDSSDLDTHWGPEFGDGFSPMRVRRKLPPLQPAGISAGAFGMPYTGLLAQFITISTDDGARIGAANVGAHSVLTAVGFDSAVFGTPKQPVYGQIEPAGEDQSSFGRGVLNRALHAAYIESGFVPAPRVRACIQPTAIEGMFGDTVVVGESNCASTLAVVAMMGDLTNFGQPGVHQ